MVIDIRECVKAALAKHAIRGITHAQEGFYCEIFCDCGFSTDLNPRKKSIAIHRDHIADAVMETMRVNSGGLN